MYTLANTTVNIYRGTTYDDQGDVVDTTQNLIAQNVLAQINPARNGTYGVRVTEPAGEVPSTVRLFEGVLPSGTPVQNTDQLVDQRSGHVYAIVSVIDTLWENLQPDLNLVLKRVTATTQS